MTSEYVDLCTWRHGGDPDDPERLRSLTPGAGWYVVRAFRDIDKSVHLDFEPVAAFALRTRRYESGPEDQIVPAIRHEGSLTTPSRYYRSSFFDDYGYELVTEAERSDPERMKDVLQEQTRVLENREREEEIQQKRIRTLRAFVDAQPKPAEFAAQMRATGCATFEHAYFAVSLSDGNGAAAIKLARERQDDLYMMYRKRERAAKSGDATAA